METEEEKATRLEDERIQKIYGCDVSPLAYMIEPKGQVKMVAEDEELDPKDFETIL